MIEKIIERLKKEARALFSLHDYEPVSAWETKDVIEVIQQVAAEYNNGWIPVGERLPEKHESYNITYHNKYGIQCDTAIYNPEHEAWYWDEGEFELVESKITAWQTLPEPYNPDSVNANKIGIEQIVEVNKTIDGDHIADVGKIVTNGDQIRSMANKELAEIIMCPHGMGEECAEKGKSVLNGKSCIECSENWLNAESE